MGNEIPGSAWIDRMGKHAAGRLLDEAQSTTRFLEVRHGHEGIDRIRHRCTRTNADRVQLATAGGYQVSGRAGSEDR